MPEQHSNDTWQRIKLSLEQRAQLAEAARIEAEKRADKLEVEIIELRKLFDQTGRHIWAAALDFFGVDELISRAMKKAEKG